MSRKFFLGFVAGLLFSVAFWRGCAAVDHRIAGILHAAHGWEEHDR